MSLLKPNKKGKPTRLNEFIQVNTPIISCSFRCKPQDKAFRVTNLWRVVFTHHKPAAEPQTIFSVLAKYLA